MDKMLFENFIVGKTNEEAFNLARMTTETNNNDCLPLFIFGETGVGKTHLLNAIKNSVYEKDKMATVVHTSIRLFIDKMVKYIKCNEVEEFMRKFIEADYLLLDGMEDIDGKEVTQIELLRIINELHNKNTKVIVTACCLPRAFNVTVPQLQNRLSSGRIVKIDLPDNTVKIGVLEYELYKQDIFLSNNQKSNLIDGISNNIFKLRGIAKAISQRKPDPINDEILSEIISIYR